MSCKYSHTLDRVQTSTVHVVNDSSRAYIPRLGRTPSSASPLPTSADPSGCFTLVEKPLRRTESHAPVRLRSCTRPVIASDLTTSHGTSSSINTNTLRPQPSRKSTPTHSAHCSHSTALPPASLTPSYTMFKLVAAFAVYATLFTATAVQGASLAERGAFGPASLQRCPLADRYCSVFVTRPDQARMSDVWR